MAPEAKSTAARLLGLCAALAVLAACNQDAHARIVPSAALDNNVEVPEAAPPDPADTSVADPEPTPEPDTGAPSGDSVDAAPPPQPPVVVDTRPPPDPAPVEAPRAPQRAELIVPANVGALLPTDPDLTVAFIGDQGLSPASRAVLSLVKAEGAQAVVHNGDFDYRSDPAAWDALVSEVLGDDFPYFATIGNHDAPAFRDQKRADGSTAKGYETFIRERYTKAMAKDPALLCTGDHGFEGTCVFHGLTLVQSCIGVGADPFGNPEFPANDALSPARCAKDGPQVDYITTQLRNRTTLWSVCSWHKNQRDMQAGGKLDEVGWRAYRACMNAGALIVNGHEHSYARTRVITDFGHAESSYGVTGPMDALRVGFGRTFDTVTGLGGVGVRAYDRGHFGQTWFASIYTSDAWKKSGLWQMMSGPGSYGALFLRFNPGGKPLEAEGYFKDLNGQVIDSFTVQFDATLPP